MPFHYEYAESYIQLVDEIKELYDKEEHYGDDTWFYDAKHEVIDNYVVKYDYEAKEVIDKYGVFKIIQEYKDEYGDFEIDKKETKNYMCLYYFLIDNYITENHHKELEKLSIEDNDKDNDEDNDDTYDPPAGPDCVVA
jgi:hypothetical protein